MSQSAKKYFDVALYKFTLLLIIRGASSIDLCKPVPAI